MPRSPQSRQPLISFLQVTDYRLRQGLTNCTWTSCREGCSDRVYKCTQIRVRYTHNIEYLASRHVGDIMEEEWSDHEQIESQVRTVQFIATTQLNSTQSWVSLIFLWEPHHNHKPQNQTKCLKLLLDVSN